MWELVAPLAAVRILYLNARAKPAERREGRRYAQSHVEHFIATAKA